MAPVLETKFETLAVTSPSEHVLEVRLNRPNKLNAMNRAFWREIRECFQAISTETEWRSVVVTAAGKMFTAGLDLKDHADGFFGDQDDVGRAAYHQRIHVKQYQDSFTALEECPIPVIACIHNGCYGGGVDLACAADIRLCSRDTVFCIKEVDVGLAADVGTLQRLPKIVGNESLVREWAYTARTVPAVEAQSCGLVSRVCPDREAVREAGLEMARLIAAKSPIAVAGTKRHLVFSRDHTVQQGLEYVATWNAAMLQSHDLVDAMQASVTKKPPIFSKL